jgi:hypothetical protein
MHEHMGNSIWDEALNLTEDEIFIFICNKNCLGFLRCF